VYECDVHFEHCYALDQSPGPVDAKKACWRDWLHGYTYGQPRDRVEYAATRFSELSLDPTLPREDVARPHRRVAAPMPTSAFAPPPNVVDGHAPPAAVPAQAASASATPAAAIREVALHAPGSDCAMACGEHWSTCRDSCKDGACDGCDRAYRACMPECFREAAPGQTGQATPGVNPRPRAVSGSPRAPAE
jgi:hypothetical protein